MLWPAELALGLAAAEAGPAAAPPPASGPGAFAAAAGDWAGCGDGASGAEEAGGRAAGDTASIVMRAFFFNDWNGKCPSMGSCEPCHETHVSAPDL